MIPLQAFYNTPHPAIYPPRHPGDAGYDVCSNEEISVRSGATVAIKTGLHIQLPPGYFGKLESRSSLAARAVTVEGGVILHNSGPYAYECELGDRIAQLVLYPLITPDLVRVDALTAASERGANGFGSTGR